ncbi:MAG: hypothetical protein ABL860_08190 [Candidatus Nitrotoga sp.]
MLRNFNWITLLLAASLLGCASNKNSAVLSASASSAVTRQMNDLLLPHQTITGGQLAAAVDANGFPLPGSLGGFAQLVFPVALAARNTDLYIADSGSRRIYKFDLITQILGVVPDEVAAPWTQIQVGADRSLFVLDKVRAIIRVHSPGQSVRVIGDPSITGSLDGFVVGSPDGRVVATDRLSQRLIMFSPLGSLNGLSPPGWPLHSPADKNFSALGSLASMGQNLYAIDSLCRCVIQFDDTGRVNARIGQGELSQPRVLAADQSGHLFVADAVDRTLKVFLHGKLLTRYTVHALRANEISALAVDGSMLYLADGAGSRVLTFRIQTPMNTNSGFKQ